MTAQTNRLAEQSQIWMVDHFCSRMFQRRFSALKSSRRAIAAAIRFVSFLAESMMTRNHKLPRAGNPLNESQTTPAGIMGKGLLYIAQVPLADVHGFIAGLA
jgi:hypothetical protein